MHCHLQHLSKLCSSSHIWNQLIQASTRKGLFSESLHLYSSMLKSGVHGDTFTFPFVAKSCGKLGCIWDGRKLHAHVVIMGFQSNTFVQTSLMDMYSKCSNLLDAQQLFDEMTVKGLVPWNCMISAYCKDYQIDKSFEFLNQMRRIGVRPSAATCVSLASGCAVSETALKQGLSIHCYGIKVGFLSDLRLSTSIMSMHARFGLMDDAQLLFTSVEEKSVVTWTAMAGGYVNIGDWMKAFDLFNAMRRAEFELDSVALINLISAGALSGSLLTACTVHAILIKSGFAIEGEIAASLVNLYAKCGDVTSALKVFDSVQEKKISLWTSMIGSYVQAGCSSRALALFQKLLSSAVKPNAITIVTVLSACANLGSLIAGEKIEEYIIANGLESDLRVQTALIHMYCKCGSIERAKEIFDGVSGKDLTMWSTMINGYACHGNGVEALALFKEMQREDILKPDAIVFTDVLTACSHSGLVEEGLKCFNSMKKDYGIEPKLEHCLCIVDLLGRAGQFDSAVRFIQNIPGQAQTQLWTPMLSACRGHHDHQLRELVSEQLSRFVPQNDGNSVLMANLCASRGKWVEAAGLRSLINKRGFIKEPAWSRIESVS